MNQYIIDAPQLQSLSKRFGSFLVWIICWLMWIYLLLPLLTLAGWLMGDHNLTDGMRWFGGYKSLLQLLEIYVMTLLALIALWAAWVIYHFVQRPALIAAAGRIVTTTEIESYYQVDTEELAQCRAAQCVTVYFDDHGQIIKLAKDEATNSH